MASQNHRFTFIRIFWILCQKGYLLFYTAAVAQIIADNHSISWYRIFPQLFTLNTDILHYPYSDNDSICIRSTYCSILQVCLSIFSKTPSTQSGKSTYHPALHLQSCIVHFLSGKLQYHNSTDIFQRNLPVVRFSAYTHTVSKAFWAWYAHIFALTDIPISDAVP